MEPNYPPEYQVIKNFLEFLGIWTEKPTWKFRFARFAFYGIFIVFNTCCIFECFNGIKRERLVVLCSKMVVLLLGAYGSCAVIMLNKKVFSEWLAGMFRSALYFNIHQNNIIRKTHQKNMKKIWPHFLIRLNGWAIISTSAAITLVFFYHTVSRQNLQLACAEIEDCSMVFMSFYYSPWNPEKYYWASNFENLAFLYFTGFMNYTRDLFFSTFICYLRCKLMTLAYVIRNIEKFGVPSGKTSYNQILDAILRQCVTEHQTVMQEFQMLRRFLSSIFFFMLIVHAPIIVNTAIIVWQGERLSSFAVCVYSAAFYGCGHLFLILWLSENLSFESLQFAEALYDCAWYEMEVKHQKKLLLMLKRAQDPLVLTCGGICSANLNTFLKTMKAVYTILNAFTFLPENSISRRLSRSQNASFRRSVRTSTKSADSGFGYTSHSDTDLRYHDYGNRRSLSRNRISQTSRYSDTVVRRGQSVPRFSGRTNSLDRKKNSNRLAAKELENLELQSFDKTPILCNKYVVKEGELNGSDIPGITLRELESHMRGSVKRPVSTLANTSHLQPPSSANFEDKHDDVFHHKGEVKRKKSPARMNPSPKMMTPLGYGYKSKYLDDPDSDEEFYYDDFYYDVVKQRTRPVPIGLCVFLVMSYIVGGAFLFDYWEQWGILNAAYFCFITLTTIGFGDLVPAKGVSQTTNDTTTTVTVSIALCSLYLLFGISLLAMSFNLVQEEVITNVKSIAKTLGIIKSDDEEESEDEMV